MTTNQSPRLSDLASASQMHRHANCPGNRILIRSLRKEKLIPEEFEGEISLEASVGQRIHAAIEEQSDEGLKRTEAEIMDDCNRLTDRIANQVFNTAIEELEREKRLTYEIEKVPVFTGKPDIVYRAGNDCLDVNFKTGRKGAPGSHFNLQLRSEVVLLYNRYRPERVYAAIIEPLVSLQPDITLYKQADLKKAEAEIIEIVARTEYDATRKAGPWCTHCPARGCCPDARSLALRQPLHIQPPALPTGMEASALLEQVDTAYGILDSIWKHYQRIVRENFNAVPGWHIGAGHNVRSIDPGAALLKLTELGMFQHGRALIKETISVGELEDLMSKHWKLRGIEFDKKFAIAFRDAIKTKKTKGSLEKIPKRLLK